jgi:hypothetical protein
MSHVLYIACLAAFFILPPSVLGFRLVKRNNMSWWILLFLIAGVSWVLVNGAVYFYHEYLGDILRAYSDDPPVELLQRWSNDGAKRAFALLFGWLYGLVYLMPWLVVYGVLQLIRRHVAQQVTPADAKDSAAEL